MESAWIENCASLTLLAQTCLARLQSCNKVPNLCKFLRNFASRQANIKQFDCMSVYSCTMNSWYGSLYVHDCRLCALLIVIIIKVWCTFGYGTIMFFFFLVCRSAFWTCVCMLACRLNMLACAMYSVICANVL
jgi:hypothetical protein